MVDANYFERYCELVIYDEANGERSSVKGFRVVVSSKASLLKAPNTAEIEVYNLAPNTRSKLQRGKLKVELIGGYKANNGVVFAGTARDVNHDLRGADWVTTLSVGDGEKAWRQAYVSLSFSKNTEVDTVLRALAEELGKLGVSRGNLDYALKAFERKDNFRKYASGYAIIGSVASKLTDVCDTLGWDWSVQKNQLTFTYGQQGATSQVVKLSAATGLIGSPVHNNPTDSKKKPTVSVKALMNPLLYPGQMVALDSLAIKGTFRIQSCELEGDTHGGAWYSKLEVVSQ